MVGKNKGGGGGKEANIKETRVLRDQLIILAVGGGGFRGGSNCFQEGGSQSSMAECKVGM